MRHVCPLSLSSTNSQYPRCRSPIDLNPSRPNGGGKTLSLKAFGVVAVLARLGIPIPLANEEQTPRVDFFANVLVDVGDSQDVLAGQSTWTAKLDAWSSIVAKLGDQRDAAEVSERGAAHLVLLDELGSGTDQEAGGAVAQPRRSWRNCSDIRPAASWRRHTPLA